MDEPWKNEPDHEEWVDQKTGLSCIVKRVGELGHLCGYVKLPLGHQWFGFGEDTELIVPLSEARKRLMNYEYTETATLWIDGSHKELAVTRFGALVNVHGGITYAQERNDCWVIGFDCAHSGDLTPSRAGRSFGSDDVYRAFEWVKQEVEKLAEQLSAKQ